MTFGRKLGLVDEEQMPVSMMWTLKGTRSMLAAISLASMKKVPHSPNGVGGEARWRRFLPFGDYLLRVGEEVRYSDPDGQLVAESWPLG
jgi:hypothetical protein